MQTRVARCLVIALLLSLLVLPVRAGIEQLALEGRWRELLTVAMVRLSQLPFSSEEALVASVAAQRLGNRQAETALLMRAVEGGSLQQVAQVELAELQMFRDGNWALELVLPVLQRADTSKLQEAAVAVAVTAVDSPGLDPSWLPRLEQVTAQLPQEPRRSLQLQLALHDAEKRRERLVKLLENSQRDLAALAAAQALLREHGEGSPQPLVETERWWVALALYSHALYSDAEPILESLLRTVHPAIPEWEVRFLRGRCAFRRGRWQEAARWYSRALQRCTANDKERQASLQVHLGRTLELDGKLAAAAEAARQAVVARANDDRRLFLARLRLRQGQPNHAAAGITHIKARRDRERGQLLLALDEIQRGRHEQAIHRLQGIEHHSWRGQARVMEAELQALAAQWAATRSLLEEAADELDAYWGEQARHLLARLPEQELQHSLQRRRQELQLPPGRQRQRALARWSVLDHDPQRLAELRGLVAVESGVLGDGRPPVIPAGTASRLWALGLQAHAARWDPGGFPRHDVPALLWSASQLLDQGQPKQAIRVGDAAWRMAGSGIAVRAYPEALRNALYPLPYEQLVRDSAARAAVPWQLLAGLVREESRWDPGVLSVVGARGLTQMMPATAAEVATSLGEQPPRPEELFRPAVGLRLGAAELGRLLARFDGQWAPAVAAYNAGEAQAMLWLDQCGEGCSEQRYLLGISFGVTRSYTTEVLASAKLYADLYG